jgi:hypothetical protein
MIAEKDHQLASIEKDIQFEKDRVRDRSQSATSEGSGDRERGVGIAALRTNIDHMGFDSQQVTSSLFDDSPSIPVPSNPLSKEDRDNLDRLLFLSSSSSVSSTISSSNTSLLNNSQMGFAFLSSRSVQEREDSMINEGTRVKLAGHGLFDEREVERNESGERKETGQNLFKDDSEKAKKMTGKKSDSVAKKVGDLF